MNHVTGVLGTNLDSGTGPARWESWRPSVALCQQDDFVADRFDILHEPKFQKLADRVLADIVQVSPETDVRLVPLPIADPWDFQQVYEALHEHFGARRFQPDRHDYFAHMTTGTHVIQICLFLLTESRHFPGKLIQTSPPRGRRRGTGDSRGRIDIIDLDLSKYDRLATRFAHEQAEARDFLRDGIATRNAAFNQLIEEIEIVALRSEAPVLLSGPTGAGKTQLARRIHELRVQRCGLAGRFVEVNCATLRGDTAMSTLFGHRRGAFTGAQADRKGLLREADDGLLFLDEIGELGPDEQAMLLRAIEDHTFLPLGGDTPEQSRFQLIAGTNRDLRAEVAAGRFREDLLARINLWTFRLPALAERREDIAPNLDYELERFERETGRKIRFNKEARERFLRFAEAPDSAWRGNFRDLNAAVVRMATLSDRGSIGTAEVEAETLRLRGAWERPAKPSALDGLVAPADLAEIDPFDQVQLAHVVEVCRAARSLSDAGRTLFAASRKRKAKPNDADRLRKYLAKFGLAFGDLTPTGATSARG